MTIKSIQTFSLKLIPIDWKEIMLLAKLILNKWKFLINCQINNIKKSLFKQNGLFCIKFSFYYKKEVDYDIKHFICLCKIFYLPSASNKALF